MRYRGVVLGLAVAALSLGAAPAASAQDICTPNEPRPTAGYCFDPSQLGPFPDDDPCSSPMVGSDLWWCPVYSIGNDVSEGDLTCDHENMYLDFLVCTLEELP